VLFYTAREKSVERKLDKIPKRTLNKIINTMKRFDLIYEKACYKLLEKEYVASTFEDNLRALVKILSDNDFLSKDKASEAYVKSILAQPNNVKELTLTTQEQSLPAMKIRISQDTGTESFSVTIINLEKPNEQKEFSNSMLETIFEDVINYIKTASLQNIAPEAAIDTLPPSEGAQAQPGAGQSALPTK